MAVLRGVLPTDAFTTVPNEWLRDPRLSWQAKGLLCYLASHAAGYRLKTEQIVRDTKSGRDATRTALAELKDAGYLKTVTLRGAGGRIIGTDYELGTPPETPEPSTADDDRADSPAPEIPGLVPPAETGVFPARTRPGKPVAGEPARIRRTREEEQEEEDQVPTATAVGATALEPASDRQETSQTILRDFGDWLQAQRVTLPRQLYGRYAKEIKGCLDGGIRPEMVKLGLALLYERGKTSNPALVPAMVTEVQQRAAGHRPMKRESEYETAADKRAAGLQESLRAEQWLKEQGLPTTYMNLQKAKDALKAAATAGHQLAIGA